MKLDFNLNFNTIPKLSRSSIQYLREVAMYDWHTDRYTGTTRKLLAIELDFRNNNPQY